MDSELNITFTSFSEFLHFSRNYELFSYRNCLAYALQLCKFLNICDCDMCVRRKLNPELLQLILALIFAWNLFA